LPSFLPASQVTKEEFETADGYHILAEAYKFAFAERMKLGDADFVNVTQVANSSFIFKLAIGDHLPPLLG
jgi:gamma-glutamyltranspeptidase